uniref:Uncharacterized protein n=1 Tax=Parascaris equorum TaxID=6256 RepID=A0A914SCH9_PAREQ
MVIEIAKDDLLPQRRRSDALPEPSLRRMRWGSLKSRSYDHAGDRRRGNRKKGNEIEGTIIETRETYEILTSETAEMTPGWFELVVYFDSRPHPSNATKWRPLFEQQRHFRTGYELGTPSRSS